MLKWDALFVCPIFQAKRPQVTEPSPSAAPMAPIRPIALGPPRRAFAMGLMVASSVIISFGGLVIRSMEQADAWQINVYRALGTVVVVALILLVQYRRDTAAYVREIGRAGLVAGALLSLASISFLQAITHTTVANALFTVSSIPFIAAALAWLFLKEPLARATLVTMLAAALGISVMMADGLGSGSAYGNAMALVTAVSFAAYAVIVRHNRHINMLPTLMVSGLIVAAVAAAVRLGDLGVTLHDLLLCLLLGALLSGFANWMFITASRHLVAAELTLFMLLEFALGPIWVWLFIAEVPTRLTLVGGALVIAAVALRALIELRRSGRPLRRGRPSPT